MFAARSGKIGLLTKWQIILLILQTLCSTYPPEERNLGKWDHVLFYLVAQASSIALGIV